MSRQILRLILLILSSLFRLIRAHPTASLGFALGGLMGYALGRALVSEGMPSLVLPAAVVVSALVAAPAVRDYFRGLS